MRLHLCTSFLLGAALVIGCEKKPEQPKVDNTTTPPAVDAKTAAGNAADQAKSAASDMADKTRDAAGKAADKASDATKNAVDATKDAGKNAADALKGATPAAPATPDAARAPAAGATDAVRTQATDLMTKLSDAIKANRLNEAQTYIDKIEAIKANLPADIQDQYVKLKAAYEKMKAGSSLLNK